MCGQDFTRGAAIAAAVLEIEQPQVACQRRSSASRVQISGAASGQMLAEGLGDAPGGLDGGSAAANQSPGSVHRGACTPAAVCAPWGLERQLGAVLASTYSVECSYHSDYRVLL